MSHLVIARKFRPQNFKTVIGQSHICKILQNSIRRNRVAHAYLFSGPRGVGKTSLARIFSKSLNCSNLTDFEPCLECSNCKEIAQGISLAVREIDGASHNSVDNIRELIDSFRAMPPAGSAYKIFIIDEVHMLSTAAFNALLKSLEEPPPNTVFILATTETHKIPETVLSRCQQHEFRMLDLQSIDQTLNNILQAEGYTADNGVTMLLARYAEGSLRDSQSLLERVLAYSSEEQHVSAESVQNVLGVANPESIRNLWAAIMQEDSYLALRLVKDIFAAGLDLSRVLKEFVEFIRLEFNEQVKSNNLAQITELEQLLVAATRGADLCLRSVFGEALFEALVVKLALRKQRLKASATAPSTGSGIHSKPEPTARQVSRVKVETEVHDSGVDNSETVSNSKATFTQVAQNVQPGLNWGKFVNSAPVQSQKILIEHLKRLEPELFENGRLKAAGPEFSISALQRPQMSEKLKQLLQDYSASQNHSSASQWKLDLRVEAKPLESVYNQEKKAKSDSQDRKSQQALEHPSVKKLQQAFPGSSVTKAVVRE